MAGGPGSYVIGEEEKKELMDVITSGNLFRYGTPGVDGFQAKVATFEKEMVPHRLLISMLKSLRRSLLVK